jgi:ribosomal protein S18 acetylase RimI-like enzyme/DNA-binding HxlR family transcriptional regulator
MYAGVDAVYRSHDVALPSRCFSILFLLRDNGRLGISELATRLGQSHPAVSQMSRKLLAHGVVREWPDREDDRRRLLSLSSRGAALMKRLEAVWRAIAAAVEELEASDAMSAALTEVDRALADRDFAHRIRSQLRAAEAAEVEVIAFERRHRADFKRLNVEWLQKYFQVEPIDEAVLSHPETIIRAGGSILVATIGDEIVGTCALLKHGNRIELSKMAVTEHYQGLGIGRRLLRAAIQQFVERGGGELFLETNSILAPAISLYQSLGFVLEDRPAGPSTYARSNVYMVYRGLPAN